MIRAGDTIENPITGEQILFRTTSAETGGEAVVIECRVRPSGFVAKPHVHPAQTELFEVVEGSVMFRLDGQELEAGPGDRVLVPRAGSTSSGTRARTWRASGARSLPR